MSQFLRRLSMLMAAMVVVLPGCTGGSKVTKENAAKITSDMTEEKVVALLGTATKNKEIKIKVVDGTPDFGGVTDVLSLVSAAAKKIDLKEAVAADVPQAQALAPQAQVKAPKSDAPSKTEAEAPPKEPKIEEKTLKISTWQDGTKAIVVTFFDGKVKSSAFADASDPEPFEQKGTFQCVDGVESTITFEYPYTRAPNVSFSAATVKDAAIPVLIETTATGFKWKGAAGKTPNQVTWTARGIKATK
jgi:hypothetical protein